MTRQVYVLKMDNPDSPTDTGAPTRIRIIGPFGPAGDKKSHADAIAWASSPKNNPNDNPCWQTVELQDGGHLLVPVSHPDDHRSSAPGGSDTVPAGASTFDSEAARADAPDELYGGDEECLSIAVFNRRFDQVVSHYPVHLTKRKLAERANFMLEELLEFASSSGLRLMDRLRFNDTGVTKSRAFVVDEGVDQDLPVQADSLVDLVYVAKGTAVMCGLPWRELFCEVQRANMEKVPGMTKRGNLMDVTKPVGWRPPDIEAILEEAGYDRAVWLGPDGRVSEVLSVDDDVHKLAQTGVVFRPAEDVIREVQSKGDES